MLPHCRGFLLLRNAPIEPDLIFLSKAVDVESQCITFASLPHLWVFGVECREIASVKFLDDIILSQSSYVCRGLLAAD